jgi:hypothetical protein
MMRIPVNLATPGLAVCPECKSLIVHAEGAWLNVSLSATAYVADTSNQHAHQPPPDPDTWATPNAGPKHSPFDCPSGDRCQQAECN